MNHLTHSEMLDLLDGVPNMETSTQHLATCPQCAREYALHRTITAGIRGRGLQVPSGTFTARTMARILPTRPSIWHLFLDNGGSIFAMILVLGIVGAVLFGTQLSAQQETGLTARTLQGLSQAAVRTIHLVGTWSMILARHTEIRLTAIASFVFLFLLLMDRAVSRRIVRQGISKATR